MSMRLSLSQSLKQDLRLSQIISIVNLMTVPDEVLSTVMGAITFNPDMIEGTLQRKRGEKSGDGAADISGKVQTLYSSLMPSKGESEIAKDKGMIAVPDLRAIEEKLGDYKVAVTPDVTYVGRKKEKPELIFSDHLQVSQTLQLLLDPVKYPETSRLIAQVRRFNDWKRNVLRDIYVILGGIQREFFERFDWEKMNIFNQANLAGKVGVTSGTISRILCNRWIEARDLGGRQKYMNVKDLLISSDQIRKFRSIPELNAILKEEFEKGEAHSDIYFAERVRGLARRTIVKYREQSGIPPAGERKRIYEKGELEEPFQFTHM